MRRTSSWTSINRNPRKGNLSLFICLHTILQVKDIGVLSYYMSLGSLVPLLKQMAIFLDWSYFALVIFILVPPVACISGQRPKFFYLPLLHFQRVVQEQRVGSRVAHIKRTSS